MIDRICSAALLAFFALLGLAYGARVLLRGPARSERVARAGTSALLGRGPQEMTYWVLEPLGRALARAGVTANMVSWTALVVGAAAGVALAAGHLGAGAVLAAGSALCDAIDGIVARHSGTACPSGEVLDSTIDRYTEMLFLGGLAVHYGADAPRLALTIAALGGSFMVSYSTAKAEALHVSVPRGAMRRAERSVYLVAGAALTPVAGALAPGFAELEAPMLAALAAVAVVANVSGVRRLSRVAAVEPPRAAPSATPPSSRPPTPRDPPPPHADRAEVLE